MLDQESTENKKLIINPEFKKQLLALKSMANTELNIQISLDKMIFDEEYRLTVFSELDGLGSNELNMLITQLKHTPVYVRLSITKAPPKRPITRHKTSKLPSFSTLFASFLLIIIVVFVVSWQNAYFYISTEKPVVAPVIITPAIENKKLTLPSRERRVKLHIHGSNTVGEKLAPALLEAYLLSQSITEMRWGQGNATGERELQYIQNGETYAIQLYAHGSDTGFKSLLAGTADMTLSSRKIKAAEVEALRSTKGDLSSTNQEYIIALDGLAIIVNKRNPLRGLTNEVLVKIFSGEINNWKQIGGDDLVINLYARDKNSGTWDTFNSLLLEVDKKRLDGNSLRFESSSELSRRVSQDIAGIGFIGLPYVNNNKVLAISATHDSPVIYPTDFTVSTEDYVLSRRLYMYVPDQRHSMAKGFSQFVISQAGQNIVEQVGFISQNIQLEDTYNVKNAPQTYNDYAEVANRLSVNFRFKSASNELDNKAKRDIKRLADYLAEYRGRRIVLMGFSDSLGDPKMNVSLSLVRANTVEKALNAYGLSVTAVEGFGAKLPVVSNRSLAGRSKNRRVEVWVF